MAKGCVLFTGQLVWYIHGQDTKMIGQTDPPDMTYINTHNVVPSNSDSYLICVYNC